MKNTCDENFKKLANDILDNGIKKEDRTGFGTVSKFGHQYRYDLQEGFPLLSLRKIHTKSMIHELLWFLESYDSRYDGFGNTNIKYLLDNKVTFWTEWAYKAYVERESKLHKNIKTQKEFEEAIKTDDGFALNNGDLGLVYGHQWSKFGETSDKPGIDQIQTVIDDLKSNPDSRRILVTSWNPSELGEMLLPPCHMMYQFYTQELTLEERRELFFKREGYIPNVDNMSNKELSNFFDAVWKIPKRKLSCQLYMRSNDVYLGNPFNVACYSLFTHMIAQVCDMEVGEFILTLGDGHLYLNSIEATKEICKRESFPMPKLILNKNIKNIRDFRYEDIKIENYESHKNIKVEVAI